MDAGVIRNGAMNGVEPPSSEAGDGPSHRRVRHSGHDHMSQRFDDGADDSETQAADDDADDALPSDLRERPTGLFHYWFPSVTMWFIELDKVRVTAVAILCFINLINYMDRSTLAGMIDHIRNDASFNVKSDKALGLLQTAFVICYMIFAPIFGYLGDRFNRKWLITVGLTFWSLSTLIGSFMTNFWCFLLFRAFVGIGEASYSTVAPAIISDLFSKDARSNVLALFFFAIPVGTGLGYILGSELADYTGNWRWGLRVTPFMGLLAILAAVFFMRDPPRGQSEGAHLRVTSPKEDIKALAKNKTYILSTVAFTCVTFCAGALMWWGPEFAFLGAKAACGDKPGCDSITTSDISYKFGIVMTLAGLLGVPGGSYVAQSIRHRIPNADPIVSGTTLLISVPILYFGFISARFSLAWCYGLTFMAGLLLNCNWAIVSDMTMYIVIPTRRSFASAAQILTSHALGDAISPYLVGVVADWIRPAISPQFEPIPPTHSNQTLPYEVNRSLSDFTPEYYDIEFRCLQYALFSCCFFQAVGAYFFLITSFSVLDDKRLADRVIHGDVAADGDAGRDAEESLVGGVARRGDDVEEVSVRVGGQVRQERA